MTRPHDLERDKDIPLYGLMDSEGNKVTIIFGHIDGAYSYCWIKDTDTVVHLHASTPLVKYKDGYKVKEQTDER